MNGKLTIAKILGLALFLMLLSQGALGKDSPPAATDRIPMRIVSLAPSATEILFALGVGDRVVGVTTFCDYPPQALSLPKIGSFLNPSIEAVLAQRPDLVVSVPEGTDRAKVKRMEELGLRVLVLPVSSLSAIFDSTRLLARAVGSEAAGITLVRRIQGQIERVKQTLQGARRRRVLFVVGLRPLVTTGRGTFIDELLSLAGGENIAAVAPQPWPILPAEVIVAQAPEVIIEAGMGSERGTRGERWGDLASIPAVREGRIYAYSSDKILRPGPRVGEALEDLARLIHPECFTMTANSREKSCESP